MEGLEVVSDRIRFMGCYKRQSVGDPGRPVVGVGWGNWCWWLGQMGEYESLRF